MSEVVIVQELLPQYRLPFYERLRALLEHDGVTLRLVHGQASGDRAAHRDEAGVAWAETIRNRSVPLFPGGPRAVWQQAFSLLDNADLVIVEHANRLLLNYALLASQRVRSKRLAYWGHGRNLQSTQPHGAAERIKRWTARQPSWWFAYTEGSAQRVRDTGFAPERITVVQNSVDTSIYNGTVGVKTPFACVFLGSLHSHKRIEFLLDSADLLSQMLPEFRLSIVGDGPLREAVESAAARQPHISYLGPLSGPEKAEVVTSSSTMLMPGLVGLAIVEAFAAGCPMVTVDSPYHSPEYEYARDGENAVVLRRDATPLDYALAVRDLLTDERRLRRLQDGCRTDAITYSLDAMVTNFAEGVRAALRASPK